MFISFFYYLSYLIFMVSHHFFLIFLKTHLAIQIL